MGVWPEDRIHARVAAAEGRLQISLERLLAEFGVRRSTPLARHNVEQALREAGLVVEPSLTEADLRSSVTISLAVPANGEPRPGNGARTRDGVPARSGLPQPGTGPPADPRPVERLREAMTRPEQHDVTSPGSPPRPDQ